MWKKIVGLMLIDQVTNLLVWRRDFFLGPLHVHPLKNFGLGFSLNFGLVANILIVALALGFFIYFYWRDDGQRNLLGQWTFALIFAGAASNILDRIVFGYVRDFLDLGLGFTFNLADAMLVVGLI